MSPPGRFSQAVSFLRGAAQPKAPRKSLQLLGPWRKGGQNKSKVASAQEVQQAGGGIASCPSHLSLRCCAVGAIGSLQRLFYPCWQMLNVKYVHSGDRGGVVALAFVNFFGYRQGGLGRGKIEVVHVEPAITA